MSLRRRKGKHEPSGTGDAVNPAPNSSTDSNAHSSIKSLEQLVRAESNTIWSHLLQFELAHFVFNFAHLMIQNMNIYRTVHQVQLTKTPPNIFFFQIQNWHNYNFPLIWVITCWLSHYTLSICMFPTSYCSEAGTIVGKAVRYGSFLLGLGFTAFTAALFYFEYPPHVFGWLAFP